MPTETKLFEVRDRGTTAPMLAVRIQADEMDADYLLRRSGFGVGMTYVLLTNLNSNETHHSFYDWSNRRTFTNAHMAIESRWDSLTTGDVVDVEFELGETSSPKVSERKAVSSL